MAVEFFGQCFAPDLQKPSKHLSQSREKAERCCEAESKFGNWISRAHNPLVMKLVLTSLLVVFTVSGALAQQLTVTIPGGHDREWYEQHGYRWHDGQWYRGEERERPRLKSTVVVGAGEGIPQNDSERLDRKGESSSQAVRYAQLQP
jgi:hypothetical protein